MILKKWLIYACLSACEANNVLRKIVKYLFLQVKQIKKLLLFISLISIDAVYQETHHDAYYDKDINDDLVGIC